MSVTLGLSPAAVTGCQQLLQVAQVQEWQGGSTIPAVLVAFIRKTKPFPEPSRQIAAHISWAVSVSHGPHCRESRTEGLWLLSLRSGADGMVLEWVLGVSAQCLPFQMSDKVSGAFSDSPSRPASASSSH